ncbi:M20/M25/M40 family metallo-hydrolase [Undibacterium sp. Di26W]|uniref:M20/M25/M40 family metallo-hydrolase n=1 Tax=Undibacterium sp. Di26W TaxID=3413035 RepID=UPI003BF09D46
MPELRQMLLRCLCFLLLSLLLPVGMALADEATPQVLIDVQRLASEDMAGRASDTAGNAQARDYIIQRLKQIGVLPCGQDFVQEFTFQTRLGESKTGRNILACRAGSLEDHASAARMVISAHYDHLGVRDGKIYYGADDNASGVAAVLAIAGAMQNQPPRHDVMFILFDAEEVNLGGSRAYTTQAAADLARIGMVMNFDMIARGDKGELYASGTHQLPVLKTLLAPLDGNQGVKLMFGHDRVEQGTDDWTKQSDHYPFVAAGVPHIYFGVEDHADYHQPTDTADKIKPQFYLGAVDLLSKASYLLDQALLTMNFRNKQ